MNLEEKQEAIFDKMGELNWDDSRIPEIMEGFFDNPAEACEKAQGNMSKDHINNLFELLECKEEDEEN